MLNINNNIRCRVFAEDFGTSSPRPMAHPASEPSVPGPSSSLRDHPGAAVSVVVQQCDTCLKRNVCPFCGKPQTKFARHVFRKHKDEGDVQRVLALSAGKEKRAAIAKLIHRGNFKHNSRVIRSGRGLLIPARRPPISVTVSKRDLLPCDKCNGFFSRRNLYRHKCNVDRGARVQVRGRALLPSEHDAAAGLERILCRLNDDDVGNAVREDDLILEYGKRLYSRLGHEPHQHAHIREKMRELGRLLLHLKKDNQGAKLRDFVQPSKFREVTDAVRAMGGLKDGRFAIPSIALKVGHALVQCAGILKSEGLMEGNTTIQQTAADFVELYKSDWNVMVSSRALGTLHERRWNKAEKLPKNDDILRMQTRVGQSNGRGQGEPTRGA